MTDTITHDLDQGSDAWLAFRLKYFGASEAAAMLGLSKTTKRSELLHAKHTGIAKEFSDFVQTRILDYGHVVEAKARTMVENRLSSELYPVVCSKGRLSASCDGITGDDKIAWECKQWSEVLAATVALGGVPDSHMPQCQQVLLVTGAERLLFTVTDGTSDKYVEAWVEPDQAWFNRIMAGWIQFADDLAHYAPKAAAEPAAVGRVPENLPALRIEVTGAVTASNLDAFKEHALAVFAAINRDLKTDQDFANAAKTVTWCGDVETRLKAAKEHALSQTESIDLLFKTIDAIIEESKATRLELDKLVEARKASRKLEIVTGGAKALAEHVAALNVRIGEPFMPPTAVDFGGVIKGMRSFDSMQDAVDTALANSKIAANEIADRITLNMQTLVECGDKTSFTDSAQLVLKNPEDLKAIIAQRVAETEKKLEAQRETIRQEETAKLQREAAVVAPSAPVPVPLSAAPEVKFYGGARDGGKRPPPDTRPPLSTSEVNALLGDGISLSVPFITKLGFNQAPLPAGKKNGSFWAAADVPLILAAVCRHIQNASDVFSGVR